MSGNKVWKNTLKSVSTLLYESENKAIKEKDKKCTIWKWNVTFKKCGRIEYNQSEEKWWHQRIKTLVT